MDIVRDPINSGDYKREEDPRLFRSTKTGRGPLEDGWRDNYTKAKRGDKPVMTAYKLCRVEFKYWGMQNKIERFIHDVGEFKYRGHAELCEDIGGRFHKLFPAWDFLSGDQLMCISFFL